MAKLSNDRKAKEDFSEIINVQNDDLHNEYIKPPTKQVTIKFDYETHQKLVLAKAYANKYIKDYIIEAVKEKLDKDDFEKNNLKNK